MLPEDIRLEVASKLQQGVEMEEILDDIISKTMKGKNLILKQDIHNI